MLYPEPQVALDIAEVAGYQAKVVYQDRNRHSLLKLRRHVGDANELPMNFLIQMILHSKKGDI